MLKDPYLQQQLQLNGFVKFPFLKGETVERLKRLFAVHESSHVFKGKFHHSTFHIGNRAVSEQVDTDIRNIIAEEIANHFSDYELFVANFMIKEPGNESEVVPHQDWTYVDEPQYMSLNLWIPLQDVFEENGCMTFLPRSHSLYETLRTSPYYPNLFDNVMPLAKKNMVPVPMKAGEAVLFSHATLHGSTINRSQERRLNVVQGIYSKGAQLHHYFMVKEEDEKIKQYDITINDFYNLQDLQKPGTLNAVREFKFNFPQLDEKEFLKFYPPPGFFKKIKGLFYGQ